MAVAGGHRLATGGRGAAVVGRGRGGGRLEGRPGLPRGTQCTPDEPETTPAGDRDPGDRGPGGGSVTREGPAQEAGVAVGDLGRGGGPGDCRDHVVNPLPGPARARSGRERPAPPGPLVART